MNTTEYDKAEANDNDETDDDSSMLDILLDANTYVESFRKCRKGSDWKESVQRYEANMLHNINKQIKSFKDGTYKQKPFNEFTLHERGKTREIKAISIEDRIILRPVCDDIITPCIDKYLIHDNGASRKGMGISHTRKRLEKHLHEFYRKNKSNEGYILLIDFTKYFDNIRHDKLIEEYQNIIKDEKVIEFIKQIIGSFSIDVSYMTDEEYKYCMNTVFNALEYSKINTMYLTKEKYMHKSVGIGSQLSQHSGLLYPIRVDNYCKIVKGLKYYGRYMDDTYIIHKDKKYLQELLKEIDEICNEYGIFINKKKTQIIKLTHTFSFLKIRYNLTSTGKLIRRVNKSTVTRKRRKLKSFRNMLDDGVIDYKEIENQYKSWKNNYTKDYDSYKTIKNMDELYNALFIKPFIEGRDYYEQIKTSNNNDKRRN